MYLDRLHGLFMLLALSGILAFILTTYRHVPSFFSCRLHVLDLDSSILFCKKVRYDSESSFLQFSVSHLVDYSRHYAVGLNTGIMCHQHDVLAV
ncbi:hypothetical protein CI102_7963 [Trichoderma harzianum]|nr:hypothetical protein CI102_7963 [Trichoderma harzianum]